MMNKIAILILLVLGPLSCGVQDAPKSNNSNAFWDIAPEAYKAMEQLYDVYDSMETIHKAMQSIQEGKRPDLEAMGSGDWKMVVEACDEAAYDLRRANYATDFNAAPYSIAPEQFKCENKDWIVKTLKLYQEKLSEATIRGKRDIEKLDKSVEHAENTRKIVRECTKIYEKVLSMPLYNEMFAWDWYILENEVSRATGDYLSELKKHRDKYQKEVNLARLHLSNLQNNMSLVEDCDKPTPVVAEYDFYSGTRGSSKVDISLKRLGTRYLPGGYIRKYGPAGSNDWRIDMVSENNNVIEISTVFTRPDGTAARERLKGSFSSDKKRLNLNNVRPRNTSGKNVTKR
jgi:hypothetical protein